jgi:hypothetical protein
VAPGPTSGEATNPRVGPTSFPRAAFLSLCTLGFRSGGAARPIRGDPRFTRTLRCSRNCPAPQFHVGRYCSVGIPKPETIMTTFPKPTGRRAYGMRGDSVLVPLHHHFTVQCRLISETWARLSAPGHTERAVWARSTAPDGLPLAGEDKQGVEPSVWIHTPILLPFAPISFVFCTCFPP